MCVRREPNECWIGSEKMVGRFGVSERLWEVKGTAIASIGQACLRA